MFAKYGNILGAASSIAFVLFLLGCVGCTPGPCSETFIIISINNANNNGPGTDTIDLSPGCIYELSLIDNTIDGNNALPSITSSIVINGNGATIRRSTSAQKQAIRLFHISQGGELTLNNVTLLDGQGVFPTNINDPIRNSGGAIFNRGILRVSNSLITANRAMFRGGGIFNLGTMTIDATTIEKNVTNDYLISERGGGIANIGTATITDSTIAGNIATSFGGGIYNIGDLTITNSTISDNSLTQVGTNGGSGIHNDWNATINYTTIANNFGGTSAGIYSPTSILQISNSIVADNIGGDCIFAGSTIVTGQNLDSDGTCTGFPITANPQLGLLTNNGGPTETHSLAPSSPGVDAAIGNCPGADQRGEPRPYGAACDLGAYELKPVGSPEGDSSTALETDNSCNPFNGIDYSLILLPIQEDLMMLPVYLRLEDAVVPGLVPPDDLEPVEYYAKLGDIASNTCGLQGGFENRLYCTFTLASEVPGSVLNFYLHKKGCGDPVVTQLDVLVPELPLPECTRDLAPDGCVEAGGEMSTDSRTDPYCICP